MISGKRTMNGTHGQVWVNGELWLEIDGGQAKYAHNKEDVAMCGNMVVDSKVTGTKGTGSISVFRVYTRNRSRTDALLRGVDERATIVMSLDDPDAYGAERVALYGVSFDDDTLMDFAAGKVSKRNYPFTFTSHEWLDVVDA